MFSWEKYLWFSIRRFLAHSETNRGSAVFIWSGSSTLLSCDPQQIPEQMYSDTVTTQRHKSASWALICSLTYAGFIKAAIPRGSDGSMNKWTTCSCTPACVFTSILAREHRQSSQCFKNCVCGATKRWTDGQANIQTDRRLLSCGHVGVLESFVMDLQSSQYCLSKVRHLLCIMDETDQIRSDFRATSTKSRSHVEAERKLLRLSLTRSRLEERTQQPRFTRGHFTWICIAMTPNSNSKQNVALQKKHFTYFKLSERGSKR